MAKKRDIHVVPHKEGGWATRSEGLGEPVLGNRLSETRLKEPGSKPSGSVSKS